MRTSLATLFSLATLVAVAIAGCGGGDDSGGSSEEDAVVAAAKSFYTAVAEGDGAAACGVLSEEATAQLEGESTGLPPGTTCEEGVEQISSLFNEEAKQAVSEVEPTVKEISGTTAIVEAETINQEAAGTDSDVESESAEIELTKEGDEWKISTLPENPQA